MRSSFKIAEVAGINIYLHWSFLLFIGWIFLSDLSETHSFWLAWQGVAFVLALFFCVVLHELGHALAARRFQIQTRDITLLPIGGVARLEKMPDLPSQELIVALAGPAVNVAIALVLFLLIQVTHAGDALFDVQLLQGNALVRLFWTNIFLVVFNLIPAFPMDGGRVLRALLAVRQGRPAATRIAAKIGQGIAVIFGILGLFGNPLLIFIAIFVFLGAQAEAQAVQTHAVIGGLKVRDAMLTRFRVLAAADPLRRAVEELLAGSQQDFPVLDGDQVIGVLRRNDLVKALSQGGADAPIGLAMFRDCPSLGIDDPLETAFETLRQSESSTLPVMSDGRLIGLLTVENIAELVMVNSALQGKSSPVPPVYPRG